MCGICGIAGARAGEASVTRMAAQLMHRGPDDEGQYRADHVALGMRRLSIIDVAGGHQPITNEDGSVVVVANGEIYNYRTLLANLEARGHRLRSRSDIETIVHLYEELGIAGTVERLRGMFAFALFDRSREVLYLVRDRLGIKPLYYVERSGSLRFASEIKALLVCDDIPREPDLAAVDAYLTLRYVPGPGSLFAGVRKVPPGHWLRWQHGQSVLERYWEPGPGEPEGLSDADYLERFTGLFTETVRLHLESDVPYGAFLSGGLDSTAIVAAMSQVVPQPVRTFSVGFDWPGDELGRARAVAEALGCEHHEVTCHPEDIGLLPRVVWHLDEPIGDAIVLPMYLLSRLARPHVKVVLSGEGADEVLAGYLFHKVMYWATRVSRFVPGGVLRAAGAVVAAAPTAALNRAFAYPAKLGQRGRRKVADYLALLSQRSLETQYRLLISLFDRRDKAAFYAGSLAAHTKGEWAAADRGLAKGDLLAAILALQYGDWLPDDILMKADKTSMANSVEGRVPFMDHVLVEFLQGVPSHLKLRGLREKVLLRDYLSTVMSDGSAQLPKRPFYMPLERYFATSTFRDLVGTCLSEASVKRRGYFAWPAVKGLLERVENGDFLYGKQVLSLLILELWHRIWIDGERAWVT